MSRKLNASLREGIDPSFLKEMVVKIFSIRKIFQTVYTPLLDRVLKYMVATPPRLLDESDFLGLFQFAIRSGFVNETTSPWLMSYIGQ